MKLVVITERAAWDDFVASSPWGHPLQLWGWGETKRQSLWLPVRLALVEEDKIKACAQVLFWDIPKLGRAIAYVPRGPVVEPGTDLCRELMVAIADYAGRHKALYLRVEPAWTDNAPVKPWRRSRQTILMNETYTFDLTRSTDELLAEMKHKTRQYVRKSASELSFGPLNSETELARVYAIYEDTAQRAGFGLHSYGYYEKLFQELGAANELLVAREGDDIVAFLWLAVAGTTAFELYGGITQRGGELRANYGLKWHAVTGLKNRGLELYDFNGRLEGGVSRFKESFSPSATDYIGSYDLPFNYALYVVWERLWPVAKPIGRKLMKAAGK